MKRLLILLCALALPLTFAPPVHAQNWPVWIYKACNKHHAVLGAIYVCLEVTSQRQADDQGFNVNSARIYTSIPDDYACAAWAFEPDPSVVNNFIYVKARKSNGVLVDKWETSTPNLKPDNDCYKQYPFNAFPGDVITTDNPGISVVFNYKARLNNWADVSTGISIEVWETSGGTGYSCAGGDDPDVCTRFAP